MYSLNVKNYKKIELESASPGKLLLRLYEGAIEFLDLAKEHLEAGNELEYRHYVGRVQSIVTELMSTLNMEAGDIARNLFALYEFMLRNLIESFQNKNTGNLAVVRSLLVGLKESWEVVVGIKASANESTAEEGKVEETAQPVTRPAHPYYGSTAAAGATKRIDFSS